MGIRDDSGEISERNEEHAIGNRSKVDFYKVKQNQDEWYPSVQWKVKILSAEPGYLAKEISEQC